VQKDIFLATEGDAWWKRNAQTLAEQKHLDADHLTQELLNAPIKPTSILEIGCSTGWRLKHLKEIYGALCAGIEPSAEAVSTAKRDFPELNVIQGTADRLPFEAGSFELVILGFCLYLCDVDDYFTIAAEVNRVLANEGHVAILDFHPPFPYQNTYHHRSQILCRKMDYSRLFSWNPIYNLVSLRKFGYNGAPFDGIPNNTTSVAILRKSHDQAFPPNPFSGG
jgi:ubiquinone/menaquinone biosynthesis C-methylase UbiE